MKDLKIEPGEKVLVCPHVGDETRMFEVIPETEYPKMIICSECRAENDKRKIYVTVVIWGEGGEDFKEALIQ